MSDEGQPLKPEHVFKKLIWRNTLAISATMEQATTWSITGIAAICGLLISNLDSVAQLVSRPGLRWSLILFTVSLVFGAVSKQLGMAVSKGLEMIQKIEALFSSESGQTLMSHMTTPPRQIGQEIAAPFFWPLSYFMRRGAEKGVTNYLSADKRFIKLFCLQLLSVYFHGAFALAALIVIAVSIKS